MKPDQRRRLLRAQLKEGKISRVDYDLEMLQLEHQATRSGSAERGKVELQLGRHYMRLRKLAEAAPYFHAASLNVNLSAELRAEAQAQRAACLIETADTAPEANRREILCRALRITRQALINLGDKNPLRHDAESLEARLITLVGVVAPFDARELRGAAA